MQLEESITDSNKNVFKHRSMKIAESVGPVGYWSTKGTLKGGETTAEKISESFHQCSLWRRSGRFPSSQGMRWRNYFLKKASIEEVSGQINNWTVKADRTRQFVQEWTKSKMELLSYRLQRINYCLNQTL